MVSLVTFRKHEGAKAIVSTAFYVRDKCRSGVPKRYLEEVAEY